VASAVLKHIRPEDRSGLYDEFRRVADHVFAIYEDSTEVEQFGPFTFYRADFDRELGAVFERVHTVACGGYTFALYRTG